MLQIISLIPPETFNTIPGIFAAKAVFALLGNVPYTIDKNKPHIITINCTHLQKEKIIKHVARQYKELEKATK